MGPRHFFVYGTLQPGADTTMSRWLASRSGEAVVASAPGRLIAMAAGDGWYPALIGGRGGERCHGTLVRVNLSLGDLARLDRYEGREYRRGSLRVRTCAGAVFAAGAYCWKGAAPAGALPVAGGDFLAWLERTRRSPFTTMRRKADRHARH